MDTPRTPPPPLPAASRLQLAPGPWRTLYEGLCARFPRVAPEAWRSRFARGRVQDAAGRPLPMDLPWRVGLEVRYFREVADEAPIAAVEALVHADADLVVADKPHGLPVMPAGRFVRETLLARLVARLDNPALVPLHRIDRATAGLVLFSANPATRAAYQALFREGRIEKTYEALAPALPTLAFPRTRASRLVPGEPFFRMCEVAGTPNSLSRIDCLERRDDGPWRYRLVPVSGRKHQLRVHMAALGAPILGDDCYPELGAAVGPLQLLARELAFDDPLDGRRRAFVSSLRLESPGSRSLPDAESPSP